MIYCRGSSGSVRSAEPLDMDAKISLREADQKIRIHRSIEDHEDNDELNTEHDCLHADDDDRHARKSDCGVALDAGCRKTVIGKQTLEK